MIFFFLWCGWLMSVLSLKVGMHWNFPTLIKRAGRCCDHSTTPFESVILWQVSTRVSPVIKALIEKKKKGGSRSQGCMDLSVSLLSPSQIRLDPLLVWTISPVITAVSRAWLAQLPAFYFFINIPFNAPLFSYSHSYFVLCPRNNVKPLWMWRFALLCIV